MALAQEMQEMKNIFNEHVVSGLPGYEGVLRAVGQALERYNLENFEMTPDGDAFSVRGMAVLAVGENTDELPASHSAIRSFWRRMPNRAESDQAPAQSAEPVAPSELQLHFTLQDIQSFESEGQARRADSNGMANASSLSQVLRCLGAYLNQKRARLLKLTREEELLSLEYETSLGSHMKESFSATGVYDMWVRMYLQRAARASQ